MNLNPPNVATFGGDVDALYRLILLITGVAFVLTQSALVWFVFRYRDRPGRRAAYVHGHNTLEIVWTVLPGLILFFLAVYQYSSWTRMKIDMPAPEEAVQVQLEPEQFTWKVRYPGADGQFDTPDDIQAPDKVMHVPVDQDVLVTLKALDVIHSFFVPQLRVKQDALPGQTIRAWFNATEAGTYEIACAELCGLGHYSMSARLTVESEAEFQEWLGEQQAAQAGRTRELAAAPSGR